MRINLLNFLKSSVLLSPRPPFSLNVLLPIGFNLGVSSYVPKDCFRFWSTAFTKFTRPIDCYLAAAGLETRRDDTCTSSRSSHGFNASGISGGAFKRGFFIFNPNVGLLIINGSPCYAMTPVFSGNVIEPQDLFILIGNAYSFSDSAQ